jgi:hypothetical protein
LSPEDLQEIRENYSLTKYIFKETSSRANPLLRHERFGEGPLQADTPAPESIPAWMDGKPTDAWEDYLFEQNQVRKWRKWWLFLRSANTAYDKVYKPLRKWSRSQKRHIKNDPNLKKANRIEGKMTVGQNPSTHSNRHIFPALLWGAGYEETDSSCVRWSEDAFFERYQDIVEYGKPELILNVVPEREQLFPIFGCWSEPARVISKGKVEVHVESTGETKIVDWEESRIVKNSTGDGSPKTSHWRGDPALWTPGHGVPPAVMSLKQPIPTALIEGWQALPTWEQKTKW